MMFLSDEKTMEFVTTLTNDPSDKTIKSIVNQLRKLLPKGGSVDAEIELIAMAVDPVHPGIKDLLHKALSEVTD